MLLRGTLNQTKGPKLMWVIKNFSNIDTTLKNLEKTYFE
jgi:hypothetical protein